MANRFDLPSSTSSPCSPESEVVQFLQKAARTPVAVKPSGRLIFALDATASRDLPDPTGGVLPADTIHRAALAAIADRFATVVPAADIPD